MASRVSPWPRVGTSLPRMTGMTRPPSGQVREAHRRQVHGRAGAARAAKTRGRKPAFPRGGLGTAAHARRLRDALRVAGGEVRWARWARGGVQGGGAQGRGRVHGEGPAPRTQGPGAGFRCGRGPEGPERGSWGGVWPAGKPAAGQLTQPTRPLRGSPPPWTSSHFIHATAPRRASVAHVRAETLGLERGTMTS